jgi:hypothetical protein
MSKYLSSLILSLFLIFFLVPLFVFGQEKDQLVKIDLNEKISQILSQLLDLKEMLAAISSSSSSKKLRYSFSSTAGNIDISPVGESCGYRCYSYPVGTQVTLTATPNPDFYFVKWMQDCSSFNTSNVCYLTMDQDRRAGAAFAKKPKLVVQVNGGGRVRGEGIDCPGDCEEFFEPNTYVTLTAEPFAGFRFKGWAGACSGTSDTCTVYIQTRTRGVKAGFVFSTGGGGGGGGGGGRVNKKLLVFMVNFNNATLPPSVNTSYLKNLFFDNSLSLAAYVRDASYNKILLGGDVVGPFTLNYNAQCILNSYLKDEVKNMARNQGIPVDSYEMFAYVAASNSFCPPRADHNRHEMILFSESLTGPGLAHEFIHAFGNPREGNALNCYDSYGNKVSISDNCTSEDYGDNFDIMGIATEYKHPNSFLKLVFGWMPSANARIVNVGTTSQQYQIYSSERQRNNTQALLIPKNYFSPQELERGYVDGYYYLEYQRITTFNNSGSYLAHNYDGLFIRVAPPYFNFYNIPFKQSYLLDAIPNDPYTKSLAVGQTFYDPIANISIKVIDRTEDYITVQIGSSTSNNYTLSVSKSGTGSGTVSGPGINCGSDCSETYNAGTTVTLTATPSSGSTFAGWSGDCSGTGSCTLTMNSNKSVTANFNQAAASGTLSCNSATSSSITLGYSYNNGSSVSLFRGSTLLTTFGSGNGSGNYTDTGLSSNTSYTYYLRNGSSSSSTLLAQATCSTLGSNQYTLTVQKSGGLGSVISDDPITDINCGFDCTGNYPPGTVVGLMAIPAPGYQFYRWSSNCTPNPSYPYVCTVTMNSNKTVTAYFR